MGDRILGNAPPPTASAKSLKLQIDTTLAGYPDKFFRGQFDFIGPASQINYSPQDLGKGVAVSRFLFETGGQARVVNITDSWSIGPNYTGIDLANRVGGIVDGISAEGGVTYLVWAFLDATYAFAGLGLTKKPHTGFYNTGGGGVKGTNTLFDVNDSINPPQENDFVVGARVLVRNTVGTAPLYEWNWGTITAINISGTTIAVDLDNNANYGTDITNVTGGEIIQWSKFRPLKLSSALTIVEPAYPYYSLIGELYINGSGNIIQAYRADEPYRAIDISSPLVYNSTTNDNPAQFSLGRYIPLWSNASDVYSMMSVGTASDYMVTTYPDINTTYSVARLQTNTIPADGNAPKCILQPNAIISIIKPNTSEGQLYLNGYWVEGGMRG
jgi:hypothetical protein